MAGLSLPGTLKTCNLLKDNTSLTGQIFGGFVGILLRKSWNILGTIELETHWNSFEDSKNRVLSHQTRLWLPTSSWCGLGAFGALSHQGSSWGTRPKGTEEWEEWVGFDTFFRIFGLTVNVFWCFLPFAKRSHEMSRKFHHRLLISNLLSTFINSRGWCCDNSWMFQASRLLPCCFLGRFLERGTLLYVLWTCRPDKMGVQISSDPTVLLHSVTKSHLSETSWDLVETSPICGDFCSEGLHVWARYDVWHGLTAEGTVNAEVKRHFCQSQETQTQWNSNGSLCAQCGINVGMAQKRGTQRNHQ